MEQTGGIASFLLTGWGVLYSVSLAWSFYSLMDQWPRLIRWGSIWRGTLGGMMISCWLLILVLVSISSAALVSGTDRFGRTGWQNSNWFPVIFGLVGIVAFMIPVFIGRAVWGFSLLAFPKEYREFVSNPQNRRYWEGRITLETARKLFCRPKLGGFWISIESVISVVLLSWALSGRSCGLSPESFWLVAPVVGILVALLAHFPWPDSIQPDISKLPPALRGKLDLEQTVTFEEQLRSVMYEREALRRVLARKGPISDEELMEEIKVVRREMEAKGGS